MPNANRGNTGFQSNEFEQEYERPSKSQLKREMTALQKLGAELVESARERVKRVPMPEDVRDAILECQNIKNFEGRRRQMQYVGKKMRTLTEEEIAAIQKTIDSWKGLSKADTAAMHALERRRDKLLADDAALTELATRYPEIDVQHTRTLIRNARKEQAENKPPKAYREIFQLLKQLQAGAAKAAAEANGDEETGDEDQDLDHPAFEGHEDDGQDDDGADAEVEADEAEEAEDAAKPARGKKRGK